jgi:hypothetical protein
MGPEKPPFRVPALFLSDMLIVSPRDVRGFVVSPPKARREERKLVPGSYNAVFCGHIHHRGRQGPGSGSGA